MMKFMHPIMLRFTASNCETSLTLTNHNNLLLVYTVNCTNHTKGKLHVAYIAAATADAATTTTTITTMSHT